MVIWSGENMRLRPTRGAVLGVSVILLIICRITSRLASMSAESQSSSIRWATWGSKAEIKPSEVSPVAYQQWARGKGLL